MRSLDELLAAQWQTWVVVNEFDDPADPNGREKGMDRLLLFPDRRGEWCIVDSSKDTLL